MEKYRTPQLAVGESMYFGLYHIGIFFSTKNVFIQYSIMKYLSNDVLLLPVVFSALHLKQDFSLDIKSSCSVSSLLNPRYDFISNGPVGFLR